VQWYTPIIPALKRLKQENHEFKDNIGYIVRHCLKKKKGKKEKKKEKFTSKLLCSTYI
jgi:hypothetical protein